MWNIVMALLVLVAALAADEISPFRPGALGMAQTRVVRRPRRHSGRVLLPTPRVAGCGTSLDIYHRRATEACARLLSPQRVAAHIERTLEAMKFRPGEVLIGDYAAIHYEDGAPRMVNVNGDYRNIMDAPVAALIDTSGPFGSGWPALVEAIATDHAWTVIEGVVEQMDMGWQTETVLRRMVADWVRPGIEMADTAVLERQRFWLARDINQHSDPQLLTRLRMFGDLVSEPAHADRILAEISQWEFAPEDLADDDFRVAWEYLTLHAEQAPWVEYTFEGPWHASTVADMRATLVRYAAAFDQAFDRYRRILETEDARRARVAAGPQVRRAFPAPAPPALTDIVLPEGGFDLIYGSPPCAYYSEQEDGGDPGSEFEEDAYGAHGSAFGPIAPRDGQDGGARLQRAGEAAKRRRLTLRRALARAKAVERAA